MVKLNATDVIVIGLCKGLGEDPSGDDGPCSAPARDQAAQRSGTWFHVGIFFLMTKLRIYNAHCFDDADKESYQSGTCLMLKFSVEKSFRTYNSVDCSRHGSGRPKT